VTSDAGHSHHVVLERLSERLEHRTGKRRELVEQQNASVGERTVARQSGIKTTL
jgi:hypothetical protein